MEYKLVQNGMRIDFFDQVKKHRDKRDKWEPLVITGLDSSLSSFAVLGRMGHE